MAGFVWKVAMRGYDWVEEYHSPDLSPNTHVRHQGLCLIPSQWCVPSRRRRRGEAQGVSANSDEWRWEYRSYEPLKEASGLFRTFADTEATREGIRAFANEYGHLGEGGWWTWAIPNKPGFDSEEEREEYEYTRDYVAVPQSFQEWSDAILKMRHAVKLWQQFRTDSPDEAAGRELQEMVDKQLTDIRVMVKFQLLPRLRHQPPLHLLPSTLLGAMWVQLATAVSGDKTHKQCEGCRRWFELSPEVNRSSRQHCSDACRSRAYRGRKDRAIQFAQEGKSVRQIAEVLDSDEETVKGWLGKKR